MPGLSQIRAGRSFIASIVVLIDGSEFTAAAELRDVYGARFVLLDDIRTVKNHANFQALSEDPGYLLIEKGDEPRNGYAVFERVTAEGSSPSSTGSAQVRREWPTTA